MSQTTTNNYRTTKMLSRINGYQMSQATINNTRTT